jgi:hypothetical protein
MLSIFVDKVFCVTLIKMQDCKVKFLSIFKEEQKQQQIIIINTECLLNNNQQQQTTF